MESLTAVRKILRHRNSKKLVALLSGAYIEFDVSSTYGSYWHSRLTTAVVYAPLSDHDRLKALPQEDRTRILDAIVEVWPPQDNDMEITSLNFRIHPDSLTDTPEDTEDLLQEVDRIKEILISVSTGGPKINEVNNEYRENFSKLTRNLKSRGIENPVPYGDLWNWYGKWSSGDLPTYQSRRQHLQALLEPLEKRLRNPSSRRMADLFQEPSGWPRVDRALEEVKIRLESASSEEQFQAVGLVCRELLISLAQSVFDSTRHPALDQVKASKTDAKRMLERYLAAELEGASNSFARKFAKTSLDLAVHLQHDRSADFRTAALCAEATASVVNVVSIVEGRRDPMGFVPADSP